MIYSPQIFIGAHQDITNRYYNHSYPRYVRHAMCSKCGKAIGEQVRYPDFEKEFKFDETEKNSYKYCPYCGHEFKEELK